jgi:hypothetical protein
VTDSTNLKGNAVMRDLGLHNNPTAVSYILHKKHYDERLKRGTQVQEV